MVGLRRLLRCGARPPDAAAGAAALCAAAAPHPDSAEPGTAAAARRGRRVVRWRSGPRAAERLIAALGAAVLLGALLPACAGARGTTGADGAASGPATSRATTASPSPSPSASAVPAPPEATARGSADVASWWRPGAGLSWQWQLTTPVDTSVVADVYDIDADDNPASVVAALHRAGRRVICYVNAGSWEPYRPDAGNYPKVLLGKLLDGWPDERWLDIRRLDLLTPLLAHRLDECRAKGFDGVEPDNVDGYENDTGFPLTAADQLAFDRTVARLAHQRGLAVGLKNDFDQVAALQPDFDYGVDEQCAELNTCAVLSAFVKAGKPVFDAEYSVPTSGFCALTRSLGISAIRKRLELDAWRQTC